MPHIYRIYIYFQDFYIVKFSFYDNRSSIISSIFSLFALCHDVVIFKLKLTAVDFHTLKIPPKPKLIISKRFCLYFELMIQLDYGSFHVKSFEESTQRDEPLVNQN